MRSILIDWLCQVHHRFRLLQETLYLTVSVLDRFLQVTFCLSLCLWFQFFSQPLVTKLFLCSYFELLCSMLHRHIRCTKIQAEYFQGKILFNCILKCGVPYEFGAGIEAKCILFAVKLGSTHNFGKKITNEGNGQSKQLGFISTDLWGSFYQFVVKKSQSRLHFSCRMLGVV